MKILSLSGILGYGYSIEGLEKALENELDIIGVDGGSTDPGPYFLGSGESFTNRTATKRDTELVLPAAIERNIPFIVGTAGGSGGEPHLHWAKDIIEEVAKENNLNFKMAVIHSEVSKEYLKEKLREGKVKTLGSKDFPLTEEAIDESIRLVGQIGIAPFIKALDEGADVILAGRACDTAIFAAPAIRAGFDPGLAFHLAKIMECGAMCAKPMSASDVILGEIQKDHFTIQPPNPLRKCLVEGVAAHTLYEQANPYYIYEPDGMIDLRNSEFEQFNARTVKVSGSKFVPTEKPTIKIEGVKLAGYRTISIGGIREELMIKKMDEVVEQIKGQVEESLKDRISPDDYTLNFRNYGINAVENNPHDGTALPSEVGMVIDVVGKTQDIANDVCANARAKTLHCDYPGRKTTAGNIAFPYSPSDIPIGPVYNFSVYHLVEVEDLMETAKIQYIEVGVDNE